MSLLKKYGSTCSAVGCSMRPGTNLLSQVRLFSFPKDLQRRKLWELAVKRENWNAASHSKLCNFHFITGAPSSIKTHPDYVPTIFKHSRRSTNVEQKLSRYERSVKRRQVQNKSLILNNAPSSIETHPVYVPTSFKHCQRSINVEQKFSRCEHSVERRQVEKESLILNNASSSIEMHPVYVPTSFKPCQQSTNVEQNFLICEPSVERKQVENESLISDNSLKHLKYIGPSTATTIKVCRAKDFSSKSSSIPGTSLLKKSGTICCAVGCSMRRRTNLLSKVRLFSFPKDPQRRKLWEMAVKRKNWKAASHSQLCNFHFVTGAPSSNLTHPDYVPTIFNHQRQTTNRKQKLSRYKRSTKRRQVQNESLFSDNAHKSPKSKSRLKPYAVPSLYLPVTDYSEKRTKKYQEDLKKNPCNKVSNRSVSHSLTASQKSTLLNKTVNKLEFDPIEASEKDLRLSTIELWQKNEALKKNIKCLQNEGYKEDELKRYTDTLEKNQYLKDLAMRVMERLADIENTTIEKVQEDFDMTGFS